jgi:hypothetical protein
MKFKIKESKIFNEAGVDYLVPPIDKDDVKPPGEWMHVFYSWIHIPTGRKGQHSVYVHHADDIDKLLNHWNEKSSDWKYSKNESGHYDFY